tara:strand:+ start:2039 stop:3355 length:1317 start_codon:yes stop_codon:yes gene_type:complete
MRQRLDNTQWYSELFHKFENRLATSADDLAYRRDAIKDLTAIGFPGSRDEEWRDTSLSSFFSEKFVPSFDDLSSFREIKSLLEVGIESHRIVFVDGHLQESLSDFDSLQSGLKVSSNVPVSSDMSAKVRDTVSDNDKSFFLLNSAMSFNSTNVLISEKSRIEKPIEFVFIALGDQVCSHPRISVLAGKHSSATIVERYISLAQGSHFTNAQVSIHVEETSQLDHVRIQDENHSAYHISSLRVQQDNSSVFRSTCISLGGFLTRNHICTSLNGEGIESTLNGLYLIDGNQHVDNHTLVEHKRANSKSFELYKGILFDKSTGVFRGQVLVRQEAQKTDAYQQNKNLLLSEDAEIRTKPQLEIYADDVKCSHGATIGQLDTDAIFYLRSRGINYKSACQILTLAFARQITDQISNKELRESLYDYVSESLISKFSERDSWS